MDKILSITIPSYNVEKFLEDTLNSFLLPEVLEDIEVLVVDDGSKDSTPQIGRRFEAKYPNSFRVISKENGGHGSTINTGISAAKGKYFKVVDGDDWVDTDGFIGLVEFLKHTEADMAVADYYEVNEVTGEKKLVSYSFFPQNKTFDYSAVPEGKFPSMHSLVYKTEILRNNKILLDEKRFYVDVEYILFPVPFVKDIVYFNSPVYMYRLAQLTQSVSMAGYRKNMQHHIDVIFHLSKFYEENKNSLDKAKKDCISKRIAQMVGNQIDIFLSYEPSNREIKQKFIDFENQLKAISPYIYGICGNESGTLRLLRKTGFRFYKLVMTWAQKRNNVQ